MAHQLRTIESPDFYVPWKPRVLTYEDVGEIQRCYKDEDMTYREIAEAMGVSMALIGRAVKALRADLFAMKETQPRTQGQQPKRKRA